MFQSMHIKWSERSGTFHVTVFPSKNQVRDYFHVQCVEFETVLRMISALNPENIFMREAAKGKPDTWLLDSASA